MGHNGGTCLNRLCNTAHNLWWQPVTWPYKSTMYFTSTSLFNVCQKCLYPKLLQFKLWKSLGPKDTSTCWYWSWRTQPPKHPTVIRAYTLKTTPPLWDRLTDFSCHLHVQATPENNSKVTNTRPTEEYQPPRFLQDSECCDTPRPIVNFIATVLYLRAISTLFTDWLLNYNKSEVEIFYIWAVLLMPWEKLYGQKGRQWCLSCPIYHCISFQSPLANLTTSNYLSLMKFTCQKYQYSIDQVGHTTGRKNREVQWKENTQGINQWDSVLSVLMIGKRLTACRSHNQTCFTKN